MLDEQLASDAAAAFKQATSGRWPCVRTEIQDDGNYLLLSVYVPSTDISEIDLSVRRAVVQALNSLIPIDPKEPVGYWIVAFIHNQNVYDSILANEF